MAERTEELILLDTHVWLWMVWMDVRLSPKFAEIIRRNRKNLCISVISCWEISMLVAKQRLDLGTPAAEWFKNVISESGIRVLNLTPEIAADAYTLPGKFHDDPADRMIVATARNMDCLLLTEDKKILKYPHVRKA